jgi:hypothetical protein
VLDPLEDDGTQLVVFATHHATPEVNGEFPPRGDHKKPRIFENDLGWTVTLLEPYVITTDVRLADCRGFSDQLEMWWGHFPEDMRLEDLDVATVAGLPVPAGEYCKLWVRYSGYEVPPEIPVGEEGPFFEEPPNEEVVGSSIFLRGSAAKDDALIQFQFRVTSPIEVQLDLSRLEGGGPVTVEHRESFTKDLTVSKAYDRFFDGVDFASYDQAEVEADLVDTLRAETRISLGAEVTPYEAPG